MDTEIPGLIKAYKRVVKKALMAESEAYCNGKIYERSDGKLEKGVRGNAGRVRSSI